MLRSRTGLAVWALFVLVTPCPANAGANETSPTPGWQLTGTHAGEQFGRYLGSPGDLDHDGCPDLLVGSIAGTVRRFGGCAPFDTIPEQTFAMGWRLLGMATQPVDVNADGWPDLVFVVGSSPFPQIVVHLGRSVLSDTPDYAFPLPGSTVSPISIDGTLDVDGDGFHDLVVGWPTPFSDGQGSYAGRVLIYRGGPTFDATPDWQIVSPLSSYFFSTEAFGWFPASVGDFDGDGVPDLGVFQRHFLTGTGHLFIYRCGRSFDDVPDADLSGTRFFNPGPCFASMGDLDRDGYDDVAVVGDRATETLVRGFESLWIYGGGSLGSRTTPDIVLDRSVPVRTLYSNWDVLGSGTPSLVAASPFRVDVLEVSPLDTIPEVQILGSASFESFGTVMTRIDITGDGVPELVVAAPEARSAAGNSVGRVAIYKLARPLPARLSGLGDRPIVVATRSRPDPRATVAANLRSADGRFELSDVNAGSLRLESAGTGSVATIAPTRVGEPTVPIGGGEPRIEIEFSRADLALLFDAINGKQDTHATMVGELSNGRRIQGDLLVMVVGGEKPKPAKAAVTYGTSIAFDLQRTGIVRGALYDIQGRFRAMLSGGGMRSAGRVELRAPAARTSLPSGVYFYRVETPEGIARGRLVLVR